jgi:hypothetical protein
VRPDSPRDRIAAITLAAALALVLLSHLARTGLAHLSASSLLDLNAVAVPAAVIGGALAALAAARWLAVRRALARRVTVELLPGEDFDPAPEAIERFAAQLARTRPVAWRLIAPAAAVRILISTDRSAVVRYTLHAPRGSRRTLETALAAYDGVELHDPPATNPRPLARARVVRARLVLARPAGEPLADGELKPDPLASIAAAMADLDCAAGEHAAVALDLQPLTSGAACRWRRLLLRSTRPRTSAGSRGRDDRRGSPSRTIERRHGTRALDRKLDPARTLLRFSLLVRVEARDRSRAVGVMRSLLSCADAMGAENHLRVAGLRLGTIGFAGADLPWRRWCLDRRLRTGWSPGRRKDLVTSTELRGLLKPPTVHCHADNVARSLGAPAPPRDLVDYHGQPHVIPLGRVRTRTGERMVGVRTADTFFSYMAGRSRYGKTETAIGQFVALVRAGAGGLFVDPHADAIAEIKAYLTDPGVRERVVEIDLSDRTGNSQPAWNLFALEHRTPVEAAARVDGFVDALAAALRWDERNTRALNLATQAAQALTELALILPPALAPTIFQVPTLLSNDEWRSTALAYLSPASRGFFRDRFPSLPGEAITAVTNLIDRLRAARPVAALLGTPVSTYDARRALSRDLIVLACPGSGSTRDRLLANLLVYDVLHAAKARAAIAPEARRPFWVFLDELQTYDGPNLPALLEQSAKYGGRAFLFNQNPERLTAATWNAVSTNRSHLLSTTVNAKAARMIAAEWGTLPAPGILTRLDRYTYLASVTHATKVSRPFLVHGLPARELHADHHHPEAIPALQTAIEETAGCQPIAHLLAAVDGHDERILDRLKTQSDQQPGGPHVIRPAHARA